MIRSLTLVAAALVAAGCGSPSVKEFRADATRVCTEYQKELFDLPMPTNEAEDKRLYAALGREQRELFADLEDVDAPESERERFERAVKTRSQEKAFDDMLALGLPSCAMFGAPALGMDDVHAEIVTDRCSSAVNAIEDHIRTKKQITDRARGIADELRLLARDIYVEQAPPEARKLWSAALGTLRATARQLDALSRASVGEAIRLQEELDELLHTGDAQWHLLNLEHCGDVYPTVGNGGDESVS